MAQSNWSIFYKHAIIKSMPLNPVWLTIRELVIPSSGDIFIGEFNFDAFYYIFFVKRLGVLPCIKAEFSMINSFFPKGRQLLIPPGEPYEVLG